MRVVGFKNAGLAFVLFLVSPALAVAQGPCRSAR
jgi:hypothetical protein